jgi:hypothetical protein
MGTLGGINGLDPTKPCMPGGLCYVNLGTALVSPSSYALYISAIAVLIQVRRAFKLSSQNLSQSLMKLLSTCASLFILSEIFFNLKAIIYVQLAVVADHSCMQATRLFMRIICYNCTNLKLLPLAHGKLYMLLFGYAGAITVILWAVLTVNESKCYR